MVYAILSGRREPALIWQRYAIVYAFFFTQHLFEKNVMPVFYHEAFIKRLSFFSAFAIFLSLLVSGLVLVGWQFDIAVLKSMLPGLTAMNPGGTALAFILASLSLWLQHNPEATSRRKNLARLLACGVLLITLCWFAGQITGTDSGPDQMLFRAALDREAVITGHPNRMAPNTVTAFFLFGIALLTLDLKIGRIWPAQILALITGAVSILTIAGYAYSAMSLAGVRHYIPMALNTGIIFLLLSLALLFIRPDRGITATLVGTGAGGMQARRLLPLVLLAPVCVGFLLEFMRRAGWIDQVMLLSTFALANTLIFTFTIWWSAASLEKTDQNRRTAEENLHAAKDASERANSAKSDFLANMSHELRTPLNSIIGLNRMLLEDPALSPEQRDSVSIAYRSAESLLNIVNDILDLSKIEAGKIELEQIAFSLQEVINNIMESFLPLCSEKGLTLSYSFDTDNTAPYLVGDPVRLSRVLINLVGNAIKYTENGSIHIHITGTAQDNGMQALRVKVSDTGIGIAHEKIDHIFEKFTQEDSSITRRFGGTGLGLHISRHLVENMGGTMGAESTPGDGAVFWFELSLPCADTRSEFSKKITRSIHVERLPAAERVHIEDARVLVVEDHPLNQVFMRKLMAQMGFKNMDLADNGQIALHMLAKQDYDVVLMDCHMPVMSGYDATREIRAAEKASKATKQLPIIAMTADAMPGTREKCLVAGMDDYISKPLNSDILRQMLSRWVTFANETEAANTDNASEQEFDLSNLLEIYDGADETELQEMISLFIRQSEETLQILHENCLEGENQAWVEAAHKMKGAAALFQATALAELCQEAQEMSHATTAERQSIYADMHQTYIRLRTSLQERKATG